MGVVWLTMIDDKIIVVFEIKFNMRDELIDGPWIQWSCHEIFINSVSKSLIVLLSLK